MTDEDIARQLKVALATMEGAPGFAELTYGQQLQARRGVALSYLRQTSQWTKLSPGQQNEVLAAAALGPPVFQNKVYGSSVLQAVENYKQEEVQIASAARELVGSIPKWATRGANPETAGQAVASRMPRPALDRLKAAYVAGEMAPQMHMARWMTTKVADPIAKALGIDTNVSELVFGDDARKAHEYIGMVLDGEDGAGTAARLRTIGNAAGFALNVAGFATATRLGPTEALNKLAVPAAARALMGTGPARRLATAAVSELGPHAVKAIGSGLVGAIDKVLENTSSDNLKAMDNVAGAFGQWAAGDFVFSVAFRSAFTAIAKTAGKLLGGAAVGRRYGELMIDLDRTTKQVYEDALASYLSGRAVDEGTLGRLPVALQDNLFQYRTIVEWMKKPKVELGQQNPVVKTMLAANNVGLSVRPLENGGWRLTDIHNPTMAELHPNVVAVNLRLRDELRNQLVAKANRLKTSIDDVIAKEMEGSVWWTQPFDNAPDSVSRLFGKDSILSSPHVNSPAMARALEKDRYVPVWKRGALNSSELEALRAHLKAGAEYFEEGYVGLTVDRWRRADRNLIPFSNTTDVRFRPGQPGPAEPGEVIKPAIAVARKVAPVQEVQAAGVRAERLLRELGQGTDRALWETPQTLQRYLLMEKGFDAARLPDGTVQMFYPGAQIKLIDDRISSASGRFSTRAIAKLQKDYSDTGLMAMMRVELAAKAKAPIGDNKLVASILSRMAGPKVDTSAISDFTKLYLRNIEGFQNARVSVVADPQLTYGTEKAVRIDQTGTITLPKRPRLNLVEVRKGREPTVVVRVPADIAKPSVRRNFVEDLTQGINALGPESYKASRMKPEEAGRIYSGTVARYSVPEGFGQDEQIRWSYDILTARGGSLRADPNGRWTIELGESRKSFDRWEDAFDHVLKGTVTRKQMEVALADRGYRLKDVTGSDGRRVAFGVVDSSGKYVPGWQGATIADLIDASGIRPKLDGPSVGPRLAVIGGDPDRLVYQDGIIIGGQRKLASYLDGFEDWKAREGQRIFGWGEAEIRQASPVRFHVEVPQLGARETFSSLQEAKDWVSSLKTAEGTWKVAGRRGFEFQLTADGYRIMGQGTEQTFSTLEAAQEFLAKYPDPGFAPPIAGDLERYTVEVLDYLKVKADGAIMPRFWMEPKDTELRYHPTLAKINQFLLPRRTFLEKTLRSLGRDDLMAHWRNVDKGVTLWKFESDRGAKLIRKMFDPLYEGQSLSVEQKMWRRMQLADYLETKPGADRAKFLEKHGLSKDAGFLKVAASVEDFYDSMGARFNIDPRKWRSEYLPHVQRYMVRSSPAQINQLTGMLSQDAVETIFGKYVPKEIRWWAENERVSDLLSDFMDRDPLSQMLRYNTQGLKKLYVDPPYRYLVQAINKGEVPDQIATNLKVYFRQINGTDITDVQRVIGDFQDRYAKAIAKSQANLDRKYAKIFEQYLRDHPGLKSGAMPADMAAELEKHKRVAAQLTSQRFRAAQGSWLAQLYTLNYGAYMGWRPWITIRNMLQVEHTLAARVGTSYVHRAMVDLDQNWAQYGHIVDLLRSKGLILDTPPIIGDIIEENWKLGPRLRGVVEHGLRNIGDSDIWSRVTAWRAAEIKWNEAMDLLKQGKLQTVEQAVRHADVDLMAPDVFKRVMSLMEQGKPQSALDVFGTSVVEETMFVYRKGDSPIWKRGVMGTLFGQFMVYPYNYAANIAGIAAASYAPVWKRVAALTRLALNGVAIYEAFRAMGVDARDFLPWNPFGIRGGPNFWLFTNALSVLEPGYRGRQARSEFERILPVNLLTASVRVAQGKPADLQFQIPSSLVPGYYMAKGLADAAKLMDEGKVWQAFLRAGSFPLANDEESR